MEVSGGKEGSKVFVMSLGIPWGKLRLRAVEDLILELPERERKLEGGHLRSPLISKDFPLAKTLGIMELENEMIWILRGWSGFDPN